MNAINYSKQLFILILWAIGVGFVFKLVENRQVAGLIAGIVFILIPIFFLWLECRKKIIQYFYVLLLSIFLIFSAIPIFLLRILNWGTDFKELSLLGVSAELLHRSSTFLYILIMLAAAYLWWNQSKSTK